MIGQELIDQYQADGAVCVRGAFDPRWIALLGRGVDRMLASPGPFTRRYTPDGEPGGFTGDYCSWRRIPEYEDFLRHSPAAAIAGAFMTVSKVNLFHEHVLVKEPGTREPTPWHHDMPYYFLAGDQVCSLWIPLDPLDRATAIEYVLGSHRWGRLFTPRRFIDGKDNDGAMTDGMESTPDINAHRDQYRIGGWAMEPGDCIVFHAMTLHGAPGNGSANRRRAFAARFMGDDVRYRTRPMMSPPPHAFDGLPEEGAPMDSDAFPVLWRRAA